MEHTAEFRKMLDRYGKLSYIRPSMLPDIELYMDQLTTFMDQHLEGQKRYPDDKILTKTMINNYTKNNLLPPSDKKKYSQEHLLLLIFIYYLKNILSISDIQSLLKPMTERFFDNPDADRDLKSIYRDIVSQENSMFRSFYRDIIGKVNMAEKSFTDAPDDEKEYLQNFSMVCMLAFDVYLKKQMIETLIDDMNDREKARSETEKAKKPDKKAARAEAAKEKAAAKKQAAAESEQQ